MPALDDDDLLAAGQAPGVLQLGHGADGGVAAADLGEEDDLARLGQVGGRDRGLGLGRVELDGDVHVWQDHPRGEGEDGQFLGYFRHFYFFFSGLLGFVSVDYRSAIFPCRRTLKPSWHGRLFRLPHPYP